MKLLIRGGRVFDGRQFIEADVLLQWTAAPVDLTDRQGHRVTSDRGYRCRLTIRKGTPVYEG